MTTLNNKNKALKFSHANGIHENIEYNGMCRVYTYTPELPTITCSEKTDAEYIQQRVNSFIRELSHEILEL